MSKSIWDTPEQEAEFDRWLTKAKKQFMVPVVVLDDWFEVDDREETSWWPSDSWGELKGLIQTGRRIRVSAYADCFGARFSAPGFMDCTDWCVFATEREAWEYLMEQDDGMEEEEEADSQKEES